ncbi:MAG TPA: hypothetical protein VGG48_19030 [Rhizomicrobium sp.]|jgi:hypothetical protein
MRQFLIMSLAVIALSGCISPEEQAAAYRSQVAAADAADNSRCLSYGTQPGTSAYTQCRMQLTQLRAQAAQQDQDRRAALISAYLAGHQNPPPATFYPIPTTPTTNCTTTYIGNQAYTNCH